MDLYQLAEKIKQEAAASGNEYGAIRSVELRYDPTQDQYDLCFRLFNSRGQTKEQHIRISCFAQVPDEEPEESPDIERVLDQVTDEITNKISEWCDEFLRKVREQRKGK